MSLKQNLRGKFSRLRAGIEEEERQLFSLSIADRIKTLPITGFSVYHCFLSRTRGDEVDTAPIISYLHSNGKLVCVPRIEGQGHMSARRFGPDSETVENNFGIPEPPVSSERLPERAIDVVFVPLLAFDLNGSRLGYGGGFYDRLYASCRPETIWIGLSLLEASEERIPHEPHDLQLDYALTPTRVYHF